MAEMNAEAVVATEMERVTPLVEDIYETDDTFYGSIDKDPNVEVVSARDMRIPLKLRTGQAFGTFDPDGGDLGVGGGTVYDKAVIDTFPILGKCRWTKKSESATDTSRKAVVNTFNKLVADAMPQFKSDSDKLCMQPGTGVLGTISAVSTAGGVDTVTLNATGDGFGAMLLRYGLKVNVYTSNLLTNLTAAGETTITFYDPANKIIELTPAVASIAATNVIVLSGLAGASPVALKGVTYHNSNASTGTWLGLSRVTNPEIRSTGVNAASGALQLPMARLVINKIRNRIGLDKTSRLSLTAWCNPAQTAAYEELGQLVSIIQKQSKPEDLNLYFGDGFQLAGASMRESIHWDMTRVDFLVNNFWGRAQMQAPGFFEVGGRKFFEARGTSGGVAAATDFYLWTQWNLFCKNPASAGYIYGLAKPTGY